MAARGGRSPDDADEVVDADPIALWAASVRERCRIAGLQISALDTGSELTHTLFFGPHVPKPLPGTEEVIRLKVE